MRTLAVMLLCGVALQAQSLASLYQAVLAPPPDIQKVAVTKQAKFQVDALQFTLSDGLLALTQPVAGHITAALFSGHGRLNVIPPTPGEAAQVQRFLGQPAIQVSFTEALFRFPDVAVLSAALDSPLAFKPKPGAAALTAVSEERAKIEGGDGWPDAARILQAVFAPHSEQVGPFLADLKTDRYGWVQAVFDPLQQEEVEVHRRAQSATAGLQVFDDVWTQFAKASDRAADNEAAHKRPELLNLNNFHLDVTIPHNLDMEEVASFQVSARKPFGRGIFLALDSNLRVTAATANGQSIAWLQPPDPGRVRAVGYQGDWLYLQLPGAIAAPVHLQLSLHGKYIIQRVGNGNYFVRSEGWYPLYPFGTPFHYANYDLVFHCDKKDLIVATGVRASDTVKDKERATEFRSSVPLAVAGFAFGQYRELQATLQLDHHAVTVAVFTNTQPDDALTALNDAGDLPTMDHSVQTMTPPALQTLNPVRLQPLVLQEVSNSLRYFDFYFGPYPYQKLAVVNIPGSYGQGWPSLVYLSNLSFLDQSQLHALGLPMDALRDLSQTFRAHEISHQWWGQRVSWASPRDQWISEGFANASALLYEAARFGNNGLRETLEEWRRDLLQRNRSGRAPIDEGPVWLGSRLQSSLDPTAYDTVVYDKGGYILYMLREMMRGGGSKPPDARFISMMQGFTRAYAGRAASTADFKAWVEKYMTPQMDLDGNHRMDWFFNEYVYGTGAPRVHFSYRIVPNAQGCQLICRFQQQPASWKQLLPVYVHDNKKGMVRGLVALRQGDQTVTVQLPFQARSAVANEFDDMLVVVTQ